MNHQSRRFFWWMLLQAQARYELADTAVATGHARAAMQNTAEQVARAAWLFKDLMTTVAEASQVHEPPKDLALREWLADEINTIIQSKDQPPAINVQYR
jgi:hypothetical protein